MTNRIVLRRTCPICNNDKGTEMYNVSYFLPEGNVLPREYKVVCCSKCGFAFADMNASQEVYNEYYKNCNIYSENGELKDSRIKEKEIILDIINSVVPKDAPILDVGCGGGELLSFLADHGFVNLTGMDPSPESIEKLRQKKLEGFVGNIFDEVYDKHEKKFKVVMSIAVAEHIYDLQGYVNNLSKYVSCNGYILLSVPAVEGFELGNFPPAHYFNHEHINYFSEKSLNNLLGMNGLVPAIKISICEDKDERGLIGLYLKSSQNIGFQYDDISEISIKKYLDMKKDLGISIERLTKKNSNLIVWGTGSLAMQLLAGYPQLLSRIDMFIDNNSVKWGNEIQGIPICPPENLYDISKEYAIIICSIMNSDDIKTQIMEMGLSNEIVVIGQNNR